MITLTWHFDSVPDLFHCSITCCSTLLPWQTRSYFSLKLGPASWRFPQWLIFFKNIFYQNICKEAISIEGGQISSALFDFLVMKQCHFGTFWTLPTYSRITDATNLLPIETTKITIWKYPVNQNRSFSWV